MLENKTSEESRDQAGAETPLPDHGGNSVAQGRGCDPSRATPLVLLEAAEPAPWDRTVLADVPADEHMVVLDRQHISWVDTNPPHGHFCSLLTLTNMSSTYVAWRLRTNAPRTYELTNYPACGICDPFGGAHTRLSCSPPDYDHRSGLKRRVYIYQQPRMAYRARSR